MELTIVQALQQGVVAHKKGHLGEAEKLYRAILRAQPDHADANHNMGVLAVGVGKVESALPFFKKAVEINPSIEQFWVSYIDAFIKLNKIEDARNILKQGIYAGLNGDRIEKLGVQLNKDFSASCSREESLAKLVSLYNQNQINEALEQGIKLRDKFRNDPDIENILGTIKSALGLYKSALINFSAAIKLRPNFAECYSNQGNALRELGRYDEAINALHKAVKLQTMFPIAHFNLGIAQNFAAKHQEAIKSFTTAIGLAPDSVSFHYAHGNTLIKLARYEEAVSSFNKVIVLKPDHGNALTNRGYSLIRLGRHRDAVFNFNKVTKLAPVRAENYNNLADALNKMGEYEEAKAILEKGQQVEPNHSGTYNNLGNAYAGLGQYEKAVDNYARSIELSPSNNPAEANLIDMLTYYAPTKKAEQPLVRVNNEIRELTSTRLGPQILSDMDIAKLYLECSNILANQPMEIIFTGSQIYRRNTIDLNCTRHKAIFGKSNIIPKYCFGCYKVQIEPKTVLQLFKLYFLFDKIKLQNNNIRKCLIELRPDIAGFYKGIIYCSDAQEVNDLATFFDILVKKHIDPEVSVTAKRGCSEYALAFPTYGNINDYKSQIMTYNEDWLSIEKAYDDAHPTSKPMIFQETLPGLCLSDFLIMRNWIVYAQAIGDDSYGTVSRETISSNHITQKVNNRSRHRFTTTSDSKTA